MKTWYPLAFALACSLILVANVRSQSPKRDFRGAWIATVVNLDWPSSRGLPAQTQKDQLTSLLDGLYDTGINAVIFQVRPECDAFYESPYEPWSYWLTGSQGTPPSPSYDPLTFAVEEAHKRGMEIHAWFNPYRAFRQNNTYSPAPNHVTRQHPEWILTCPDGYKIMDPGLPASRDHISRVISDVVRRYEVDGIHMDDYFYPYPSHGFTTEDSATFRMYPRGFSTDQVDDWRRDNVNMLMKQIYDSLQTIKPWVKFGMSPFGIYRSGVPPGISGMSSVDVIYCDALAWLRDGSVDYLTPQLYWGLGGGQDYGLLSRWWSDSTAHYGRHFYPGMGTYRNSAQVLADQMAINWQNPNIHGSIQFRARYLTDNIGGAGDRFRDDIFHYGAAIPVMAWKDSIPPLDPSGLAVQPEGTAGAYRLNWTGPSAASDGDTASRYLVYRFSSPSILPGDIDDPKNILGIAGVPTIVPKPRMDDIPGVTYSYAISSLDKNNNESGLSSTAQIGVSISTPTLAAPPPDDPTFTKTSSVSWNRSTDAIAYRVQVARDSTFSEGALVLSKSLNDTSSQVQGLSAKQTYYWRVMAGNQGGTSSYSPYRRFTTGWPLPPTIVSPHLVRIDASAQTYVWNSSDGATSYRLLVTDDNDLRNVIDVTVTDTTYSSTTVLTPSRRYTWKIQSINAYGASDWSPEGIFITNSATSVERTDKIPATFSLSQNFPNPFNSMTVIRFSLPESQYATLRIFNLLGQQVSEPVNDTKAAGVYSVHFDAGSLPSGTYFFVLTSGDRRITRRMMLIK